MIFLEKKYDKNAIMYQHQPNHSLNSNPIH